MNHLCLIPNSVYHSVHKPCSIILFILVCRKFSVSPTEEMIREEMMVATWVEQNLVISWKYIAYISHFITKLDGVGPVDNRPSTD